MSLLSGYTVLTTNIYCYINSNCHVSYPICNSYIKKSET